MYVECPYKLVIFLKSSASVKVSSSAIRSSHGCSFEERGGSKGHEAFVQMYLGS